MQSNPSTVQLEYPEQEELGMLSEQAEYEATEIRLLNQVLAENPEIH